MVPRRTEVRRIGTAPNEEQRTGLPLIGKAISAWNGVSSDQSLRLLVIIGPLLQMMFRLQLSSHPHLLPVRLVESACHVQQTHEAKREHTMKKKTGKWKSKDKGEDMVPQKKIDSKNKWQDSVTGILTIMSPPFLRIVSWMAVHALVRAASPASLSNPTVVTT